MFVLFALHSCIGYCLFSLSASSLTVSPLLQKQTQQERQLVTPCGILSPLLHPVLISLAPDSTAALTSHDSPAF